MAVGIVFLGVAVLVGDCAVGAAPDGGVVLTALLVGMAGENTGSSWCNMKWHRNGAALVSTTLAIGLGTVPPPGLALDRGERKGTWLNHQVEVQLIIQSRPTRQKSQESDHLHIMAGGCVQNCQATWSLSLVLPPPPYLGQP